MDRGLFHPKKARMYSGCAKAARWPPIQGCFYQTSEAGAQLQRPREMHIQAWRLGVACLAAAVLAEQDVTTGRELEGDAALADPPPTYAYPPQADAPRQPTNGASSWLITMKDDQTAAAAVVHMQATAAQASKASGKPASAHFNGLRHFSTPGLSRILAVSADPGVLSSLQHAFGPGVVAVEPDALAYPSRLSARDRELLGSGLVQCAVPCVAYSPTVSWGIDRVDRRSLPLDSTYRHSPVDDGQGVDLYTIDTGVRASHSQFKDGAGNSRVDAGWNFAEDNANMDDCEGHGTHVASTAAGLTVGIAPAARITPLRVFPCGQGATYSNIIAAIDRAISMSSARGRRGVINMSLGGPKSTALNNAVQRAVNNGLVVAVAAGNSNRDACQYSPASAPAALTVGATTSSDAKAAYSNYGPCVDLQAPGSSITAAWYTDDAATATISGTSMATPHTAGVALRYLSWSPTATVSQVNGAVVGSCATGVVSGLPRRTANALLQSQVACACTVV